MLVPGQFNARLAVLPGLFFQINKALEASQALGEHGDVDGSQAALNDAESLKRQRAAFEQQAAIRGRKDSGTSSRVIQKVCPVSLAGM